MMRRPSRLTERPLSRRGIILLGPLAAGEPLYLHRAARRLDQRLLATSQSVVVALDLTTRTLDCAPLRNALDRFAASHTDLVTVVPCIYPFGRDLRDTVQRALTAWRTEHDHATTCFIAGSFDQLLDLDMLIDLCLQTRSPAPVASSAPVSAALSAPS